MQALQRYNESNHVRGETLPLEHQAYHVKVVRTFLAAAVSWINFKVFWKKALSAYPTDAICLITFPLS